MHEYYFERMRVWQNCRKLVNNIYNATKKFPKHEEFHLISQMRRAASSIRANIAEGQGRKTKLDQAKFTTIAYSSLIELVDHLITSLDQGYIDDKEYTELREQVDFISSQLIALRNTQLSKME